MQLCQEVEAELRELSQECRKKYPLIKEYTDRAILKLRHHREDSNGGSGAPSQFPLEEILRAILMACETFHSKIVLISLSCLQRLILREVLKEESVAIVVNLMKEQAANGDETVQLKVLQTVMATPSHIKLLNETVVEQLMQLLYSLHNSSNANVHHTACAGLRQLAEHLADQAALAVAQMAPASSAELESIRPVMRQRALPSVAPNQAPAELTGPLRLFFIFVQDLCVMADYDASSMSTRYSMDPGERMRTGHREGYWLASVKFPRPLCLELLNACIAAHPEIFSAVPEYFALLRHNVCAALLKNLRGCFDFAILIRSVHLLQQIFKSPILASNMLPELQVFLHLMLDLTNAERSLWQRATSLEFLRSICEDSATVGVLYQSGAGTSDEPRLFSELTNALSKLMHQVCFSSGGIDSNAMQSVTNTTVASAASRVAGHESRISGQGVSILDRAGLLSQASMPTFPGGGAGDGPPQRTSSRGQAHQVRLLLLMNETEPPPIQPAFLVSLVVESVFALVSSIYRLLLATEEGAGAEEPTESTPVEHKLVRAGSAPDGPFPGGRLSPLPELSPQQEVCKGMLQDSWASLLSAVSLLLHGTSDAGLQQALRCLQTLLYCCSRLCLDQARDACLLQFSRYAWPNESEGGGGANAIPTAKNLLCFKALVNFCYRYGGLLAEPGWTIALRAFQCLERTLQKAPSVPNSDLAALRQALDSMFETTSLLPDTALAHVIGALGRNLRTTTDLGEGELILNRMVDLCNFNLARLFVVWDSVLGTITEVSTADERPELRSMAASALCKILGQALRKGALAMSEKPEEAQDELLRHLEVLLRSQHDYTRARICEGLLSILQTSGQELHPTAWSTMIHLVSTAASVELQRVGIDVKAIEPSPRPEKTETRAGEGKETASAALPTVFQLLELLVHDFMENVPQSSLPHLTASIGAMARYGGLGVSSSLTAVGFLWNVADALARYHCAEETTNAQTSFAELWAQIFTQLRVLASDPRPEVRNCAVKSLATALLSHGSKVGLAGYQRCLSEILLKVLAEIQAARCATSNASSTVSQLIVHHSRDTPEKQWDETLALAFDGVRRVLSHFSEQAGAEAFAPLAYAMLLQVQETLRTLGSEISTSAIRALTDLMRIPSALQMFEVDLLTLDERLPLPGGVQQTSVWLLSWRVLWRLVNHCLSRELPENLLESFTSSLSALRSSHSQSFSAVQHLILVQFSLVMATTPSFYLPTSTPFLEEDRPEDGRGEAILPQVLPKAFVLEEKEVMDFIEASPDVLWDRQLRTQDQPGARATYTKAAVASSVLVAPNSSRSCEIWSCEATWQMVADTPEEWSQMFGARSPTHRTMLHVSSARLNHVQGIAYGFIEETCSFGDISVEAIFLCQLCAVFLDGRRIVDSNKLALAVRTLCVLILFCRRSLLEQLKGGSGNPEPMTSSRLTGFLNDIVPMLCQVFGKLICYRGPMQLQRTGLWKLAVEALFYIVEDSLCALERCAGRACMVEADRFWDVLSSSFAKVVEVLATSDEDTSLLSQVCANLLMQRLLVCAKTPINIAERAVGLLQVLVRQSGMGSPSLRHFFALCETAQEEPIDGEDAKLSVVSATAKGVQAPVPRIPSREALLSIAAPALVEYVRNLFSCYLQEEEARQRGGSASSALHRVQEVRLALTHLRRLDADDAVVAVAAPNAEKAQMACKLAGKKGLVMALLPQLSALAPSGDPEVRKLVREVLQELAAHLELT